MASLVKTVLMLERGIMPRLANFEVANPNIQTEAWNLKVCGRIYSHRAKKYLKSSRQSSH